MRRTPNLNTQDDIRTRLAQLNGKEFIGVGNHEQYFYEDYYNYIPDMADRVYLPAEILHGYGYRFVTVDQLN